MIQAATDQSRSEPMLTVLIPAFNEASVVGTVVESVIEVCAELDVATKVLVVDDGSADGTGEVAAAAGATVVRHPINRGYGASLKTGVMRARSRWVVTIDADGQHDAGDLRRLWAERDGRDMVVGERQGLMHSQLWRMPGKWCLWILASILVGQRIPDLNSGLRLMRRSAALRYLHLCPAGFSFSTTMTMAMLTQQQSVGWMPIQVRKRVGTSTVSLSAGFATILLILRVSTLFNPLRLYLPLSLFAVFAGLGWGLPYLLGGYGLSVGAMLAFITGILLFFMGLLSDQVSQMRLERFVNYDDEPGRRIREHSASSST